MPEKKAVAKVETDVVELEDELEDELDDMISDMLVGMLIDSEPLEITIAPDIFGRTGTMTGTRVVSGTLVEVSVVVEERVVV